MQSLRCHPSKYRVYCSILYSFQEPTLPVHLQRTWQLNSSQVGLVFFGAALPAMLGQSPLQIIRATKCSFYAAPPLAGWLTDYMGAEWVTFICLLLAIPCWIAVTIRSKLSFFVTAFAFESKLSRPNGMTS